MTIARTLVTLGEILGPGGLLVGDDIGDRHRGDIHGNLGEPHVLAPHLHDRGMDVGERDGLAPNGKVRSARRFANIKDRAGANKGKAGG